MKRIMYIALLILVILLALWTIGSYFVTHSVKVPEYSVLTQSDGYEIREYKPYLTARVTVTGTHEEALNEGFRILADYIFGNNTKQTSIAMTAPVTEAPSEKLAMTAPVTVADSEKLAMTAPVTTTSNEASRTVSFVMPFEYTLHTLPKPNNPRVEIVAQDTRKVAALRFSWWRGEERVERKKQELLALLKRDGVEVVGVPEYAGYNAPLSAPWLNRNEILVEVR